MRFIDLFAGLGGFHLALKRLGHTCVFACEIDDTLRETYETNFGTTPRGDIRDVWATTVPDHDVLCAGFPCQPFSKAGRQLGFDCPNWGNLFEHVTRILRVKRPAYLMLENVPHLARHDGGRTWEAVKARLARLGYKVEDRRLSPHHFGIPQVRERLFIVGSRSGLQHFVWPEPHPGMIPNILDHLDDHPDDGKAISEQFESCLSVWQEFLEAYPRDEELPSWPIWTTEFGADYPFEDSTPACLTARQLCRYRGSHGTPLRDVPPNARKLALPSYARDHMEFPAWKKNFLRHNRALYARHHRWLDQWIPKIRVFPASLQKLEWNCKGGERTIWNYMIQFRASGVRVKRPTSAPSLISMTTTQVPIVGWQKRYLTARECSRLQGLRDLAVLPATATSAYAALGNAVNADLVEMIADKLLGRAGAAGARAVG